MRTAAIERLNDGTHNITKRRFWVLLLDSGSVALRIQEKRAHVTLWLVRILVLSAAAALARCFFFLDLFVFFFLNGIFVVVRSHIFTRFYLYR